MDKFDTLQHNQSNQTHTDPPSLLVFIIDTNPVAWEQLNDKPSLAQALNDTVIFLNAHIALNHANTVAVIASHVKTAKWVYPDTSPAPQVDPIRGANSYRPFLDLQDTVTRNVRALLDATTIDTVQSSHSTVSGAIALALAFANKQSLKCRITVLSVSSSTIQYIPMMNTIFAAQKMGIPISILKVRGEQTFLQQASDATSGIYVTLHGSILQTLVMRFLNPTKQSSNVDFRASCFCHKEVLDVGYVCSVCLSIFCRPYGKCLTCDAEFTKSEIERFSRRPVVRRKKKEIVID